MVEIEPDGRIVLPPKVREKMGFLGDDLAAGGEAAFAGFTNRFKLYRREVYEAELADDDEDDIDPLTLVGRAAPQRVRPCPPLPWPPRRSSYPGSACAASEGRRPGHGACGWMAPLGQGAIRVGLLAAGADRVIGIDRDPLAHQMAAPWAAH